MKKIVRVLKLSDVSAVIGENERVSGWSLFSKKLLPLELCSMWARREDLTVQYVMAALKTMDVFYPAYVIARSVLFFAVILTALLGKWPITVSAVIGYTIMCIVMNNHVFTSEMKYAIEGMENKLRKIVLNLKIVDGDDFETIKEKAAAFLFNIGKTYSKIPAEDTEGRHKKKQRLASYRCTCKSFGICPTTYSEDWHGGKEPRSMTVDEIIAVSSPKPVQ